MANISEILNSITGKQPNSNLTKASTTINVGTYIQKTQENKTIMEQTVVKPIVEMERHGEYIVCDLQFVSAYDADLREMYNLIEMYLLYFMLFSFLLIIFDFQLILFFLFYLINIFLMLYFLGINKQ